MLKSQMFLSLDPNSRTDAHMKIIYGTQLWGEMLGHSYLRRGIREEGEEGQVPGDMWNHHFLDII